MIKIDFRLQSVDREPGKGDEQVLLRRKRFLVASMCEWSDRGRVLAAGRARAVAKIGL